MFKFYRIPNAHCVIIERLGKYARTQKAGLRFHIRGLEKIKRLDIEGSHWGDVANKESYFIELSEQNTNTQGSKAYTKDNVEISVDASIFWQIVDPRAAVYESDCLPMAIRDRAVGVLRASIGVFDFDELSTKREQLSRETTEALVESGKKWGVKFTRVEIQQLQTDGKTQEALLQQVEADRRKKAIVAEAEGNAERIRLSAEANKVEALTAAEADEQVQVLKARGKKIAMALESEGKADEILNVARAQAEALRLTRSSEREYLEELAGIVGPTEAARLLLAQKYIEGFEKISKTPSNKVFLPNNFNAAFNLNLEPPAGQAAPPEPAKAGKDGEEEGMSLHERRRRQREERKAESEELREEPEPLREPPSPLTPSPAVTSIESPPAPQPAPFVPAAPAPSETPPVASVKDDPFLREPALSDSRDVSRDSAEEIADDNIDHTTDEDDVLLAEESREEEFSSGEETGEEKES